MRSAIALLAIAAACGGSVAAPVATAVNGSIYDPQYSSGRTFQAQDAIVNSQVAKGFAINGPAAYVEITDFAGACADEAKAASTAAYYPATGQTLLLGLARNDAAGTASPPAAPGTFTVLQSAGAPSQLVAVAYYMGGCQKYDAQEGVSGVVNLARAGSDGTLEGTFDVTLSCSTCSGHQTHVTGSFHAAPCSALSINRNSMCP